MRKKLTTRVGLLRRVAGSTWGAGAKTLHAATMAPLHYAAEHCLSVWCSKTHTRLINKPINHAWHIVSGCLRPTPLLFVLAGFFQLNFAANEACYLWLAEHKNLNPCLTKDSCPPFIEDTNSSNPDTILCLLH